MFRVADIDFDVTESILDAYIDNRDGVIAWGVEISARTINPQFGRWIPCAKSEVLLRTGPEDLARWQDLAGKSVEWSEAEDEDGEPFGMLCIFEHDPIYEGRVRLDRGTPAGLSIRWQGKFDPYIDEKYAEGLPITIDVPLVFRGILFGREPEDEYWKALAPFFPRDQYRFTQTEHGVSLLVPSVDNFREDQGQQRSRADAD